MVNPPGSGRSRSQDRAARRHLKGGHAPAVQHDKPVTVSAANDTGVLGERRYDVLNDLARPGGARFVVRDVDMVAAGEPDTQHNFGHGQAAYRPWSGSLTALHDPPTCPVPAAGWRE